MFSRYGPSLWHQIFIGQEVMCMQGKTGAYGQLGFTTSRNVTDFIGLVTRVYRGHKEQGTHK